jgi:hypothetical protein
MIMGAGRRRTPELTLFSYADQRRAIVLHHLAGLSVEEIAHEAGAYATRPWQAHRTVAARPFGISICGLAWR